jgi:tRNA G26 N,N-dimethylase Trm1
MTRASLEDLAPIFGAPPEELLKRLQARGYQAASTHDTPSGIATASAVPANEVLYALTPPRTGGARRR